MAAVIFKRHLGTSPADRGRTVNTTDMTWIVHIAADPIGTVQCCATCGHILEDWTAALEGRTAILGDDGAGLLPWWPTGQMIAQWGPASVTLPDRPLEADERFCGGAN